VLISYPQNNPQPGVTENSDSLAGEPAAIVSDEETDNGGGQKSGRPKKRGWLRIAGAVVVSIGVLVFAIWLSGEIIIPQIHYSLGENSLAKGDVEGAIEEFAKAHWYSDAAYRGVELQVRLGRELFEAGRYDEVLDLFIPANFSFAGSVYKDELLADTYVSLAKNALLSGNAASAPKLLASAAKHFGTMYGGYFRTDDAEWTEYAEQYRGFTDSDSFKSFFETTLAVSREGLSGECIKILEHLDLSPSLSSGREALLVIGDPQPIRLYYLAQICLEDGQKGEALKYFMQAGGYLDASQLASGILGFSADGLFGGLAWNPTTEYMVGNKVELVSREPVARMKLHDGGSLPDTYGDFSLAKWLNGAFRDSFSEAEKSRIISIELPDEPKYVLGDDGGLASITESYWLRPNILQTTTTTTQNGQTSTSVEQKWNPRIYSSHSGGVANGRHPNSAVDSGLVTVYYDDVVSVYPVITIRLD
jgi:tetratricopeptide (TPR) repeat protein